ncbi:MAG: hypothetical protein ACTSV6_05735 [Candidatus Heimdallarchaeota archaeon]
MVVKGGWRKIPIIAIIAAAGLLLSSQVVITAFDLCIKKNWTR